VNEAVKVIGVCVTTKSEASGFGKSLFAVVGLVNRIDRRHSCG